MLMRIKNKLFNFKIHFLYSKNPNILIYKQTKNFELGNLEFDKKAKVEIRSGLILKKNVSIRCRENGELKLGENVYFNNNCVLTCRNQIVIGNDVSVGPNVVIFDHDHNYRSKNRKHDFITDSIVIEDNVWIGASAIILKGTHIGKNSVIAAGAVVFGDIPDNTVYISKNKNKKIGEINE